MYKYIKQYIIIYIMHHDDDDDDADKTNCYFFLATLSANTDSRYFVGLADSIYRFTPIVLKPHDLTMIHGEDERISIDAYISMIHFYYNFYLTVDNYHLHPRRDAHQDL